VTSGESKPTFRAFLVSRGYPRSTQDTYIYAARKIRDSGKTANAWLAYVLVPTTPYNTQRAYRAAARHYWEWLVACGKPAGPPPDIPKALKSRGWQEDVIRTAQQERRRPTAEQCAEYAALVKATSMREPTRAVMLLLPLTPLLITELTTLRTIDLARKAGKYGTTTKKGWTPLSEEAREVIRAYLVKTQGSRFGPWLFPGKRHPGKVTHVTARTITMHVLSLRKKLGPWATELVASDLRGALCPTERADGVFATGRRSPWWRTPSSGPRRS
jgi:integrase